MKLQKYILSVAVFPLLLLQTCAKDSDENNDTDTEFATVRYSDDETVTKEMAIEDWETFLKHSQESIGNAEVNIGNLETKIDEADDYQKIQWQEVCDFANSSLIKLKAKRSRRNTAFENEIKNYDRDVYERNAAFEAEFNTEMAAINSRLTGLFEKMRSGYYK